MNNIQIWFLGFALGMLLILIVYKIVYYIGLSIFKLHGKKYNLKIIKCKRCRGYSYTFNFETTEYCCNCILLKISKEKENE